MVARRVEDGPALRLPSPVVEVRDERLDARGVRLLLKRDDLIHPDLPGNKWRKLKYNLAAAGEQGQHTLLTFGGAYSNHIRAVAAAGQLFGFATIGVIRGEERLPLNPVLAGAVARGMRLTHLDRTTYRAKQNPDVVGRLRRECGEFYLVPEGGSNEPGVRGCAELAAETEQQVGDVDVICCPVGTGGTLAGIAGGLGTGRRAIGVAVLRGAAYLVDEVAALQRRTFGGTSDNWTIEQDFHFGGYAKRPADLDVFIADFAARHGTVLDWVYVAKMMYGIFAIIEAGRIPSGATVVAVITG
jgi:1-aminocyclopropane-1-carboxylate deaminase